MIMVGGLAALCAVCVAGARGIEPGGGMDAGLFLFDQTSPNRVWEVDVSRPSVENALVTGLTVPVPEIELIDGSFYASTNSSENLFRIDAGTGVLLETIPMTFPSGGNVITAMEYVNGTLYGGFTTVGGGGGGGVVNKLVTINTTTGVVTSLGILQNIDAPLAGLAFGNGVMYAVNSRSGGPAVLYSLNLFNGINVNLGVITEQFTGGTIRLTGLEFGLDGVLYALGRGGNDDGVLFSINPATRQATRIGNIPQLLNGTALTSGVIPAPASGAILGAGGIVAARRRRRGDGLAA